MNSDVADRTLDEVGKNSFSTSRLASSMLVTLAQGRASVAWWHPWPSFRWNCKPKNTAEWEDFADWELEHIKEQGPVKWQAMSTAWAQRKEKKR